MIKQLFLVLFGMSEGWIKKVRLQTIKILPKNSSYVYSIHKSATFYVFTFSKNRFLASLTFFINFFRISGFFWRPMPGKGVYAAQDLDFGSI